MTSNAFVVACAALGSIDIQADFRVGLRQMNNVGVIRRFPIAMHSNSRVSLGFTCFFLPESDLRITPGRLTMAPMAGIGGPAGKPRSRRLYADAHWMR